MFILTDAAREHLSELLDQAQAPEGAAARVVIEDEGLTLSIDHPQEGDESGQTLHVEQGEEGPTLTVQGNE